MLPAQPVPVLLARLSTDNRPWRLPIETEVRLQLLNLPVAEVNTWLPESLENSSAYSAAQEDAPLSPLAAMGALIHYALAQPWKGPRVALNPAFPHNAVSLWTILKALADCDFGASTWKNASCLALQNEAGQILAFAIPVSDRAVAQYLPVLKSLLAPSAGSKPPPLEVAGVPLQRITVALPDYAAQDLSTIS